MYLLLGHNNQCRCMNLHELLAVLAFYDFLITIRGIVNPSSIRGLFVSCAS